MHHLFFKNPSFPQSQCFINLDFPQIAEGLPYYHTFWNFSSHVTRWNLWCLRLNGEPPPVASFYPWALAPGQDAKKNVPMLCHTVIICPCSWIHISYPKECIITSQRSTSEINFIWKAGSYNSIISMTCFTDLQNLSTSHCCANVATPRSRESNQKFRVHPNACCKITYWVTVYYCRIYTCQIIRILSSNKYYKYWVNT